MSTAELEERRRISFSFSERFKKRSFFSPKIFPASVAQLVNASIFFCFFSSQATLGQVSTSMGDHRNGFLALTSSILMQKSRKLKFSFIYLPRTPKCREKRFLSFWGQRDSNPRPFWGEKGGGKSPPFLRH